MVLFFSTIANPKLSDIVQIRMMEIIVVQKKATKKFTSIGIPI